MKQFRRFLALCTLFLSLGVKAQDNYWQDVSESVAREAGFERTIIPQKYRTVQLNEVGFLEALGRVPYEFSGSAALILALPMPDGSFQHFRVFRYRMMEPALEARFPEIQTFTGQGVEDPGASIKLDWTSFGFHAMILSPTQGSCWIDPYARGNRQHYIAYKKSDLTPKIYQEVGVEPASDPSVLLQNRVTGGPCLAGQLRSYRMAVACTGEYAVAVGGTTPALLHSAIVTSVNRVNGLYEKEVSIRLVLIANNNIIEYRDPITDPFTGNNNSNVLINESQAVISANIGAANYDIGHTFSTGGGGLAQLGSVCGANKARGITGLPNPVGDPFDIDFVSHEVGHQFGASHTFNAATGNCGGNGSSISNAEPGSGCTIMGYAGICTSTNDLQLNSDPQFHAISFDQIGTFSRTGGGSTCGVLINTGNNAPVVNAGADYTIPINTAFTLTGSATDPDGDFLTYSWEQVNVGAAFSNWNAPTGPNAPIFRSFVPVSVPTRTFPRPADLANNTTTIGEILPSYVRPMTFRLTARDNRSGGGGVCYDEVVVNTSGAAAFAVTSQGSATTWVANGSNTATITWNVSGTAAAPFNSANVDILFSADGGFTFPYTLLSNTPNDGTQLITIPSIPTTRGRVMVKSRGNIFFDINTGTITITSSCVAEGAVVAPAGNVTSTPGNPALNLNLSPQYSVALTPSGTLESSDPISNLAVFNSATFACQNFSNVMRYDAFTFTAGITATYTFTLTGVFPTMMNLYTGSFNGASPCTNFLRSNGTFNGTNVSIGSTVTQALNGGSTYTLVIGTFSDVQPPLPAPYSVSVSSASPAGGQIFSGSGIYQNPGAGFNYAYVVVNNASGNIQGISATANLTNSGTYPIGSYTVYGLSYSGTISNLNSFIGGPFTALSNNVFSNPAGFCANFSKNVVLVNIQAGPVPVRQLKLTARKEGDYSRLTWTTEEEINTSHFTVQRSSDGIDFSNLPGRIDAAGTSTGLRSYPYTDVQPMPKWNFYRIEAVDIDGSKTYSNTVALSFGKGAQSVSLYPNPVAEQLNLDMLSSRSGQASFRITDSRGSLIRKEQRLLTEGRQLRSIPVNQLAPGLYILQYILPDGETGQLPWIKQ